MKLTKNTYTKAKPGVTLIELTVVIVVLLTLIGVLFIGANIYKRGSDRTACILNIRNIQLAVRANQNLQNLAENDATNAPLNFDQTDIFSPPNATPATERFLVMPTCPTDGGAYLATNAGGVYPSTGIVVATCSTNGAGNGFGDHFPNPATTNSW